MYGQYAGGGFGADENARKGPDPRKGFETARWSSSCTASSCSRGSPATSFGRTAAFNSLACINDAGPKAPILTAANMPQLDRKNKAPGIENGGTMLSFSPYAVYRCCQHNVSHGWPYYCEELWLATHDHGLCASLYAASEVTAKVGDGKTVTIAESTDYPFSDAISLRVNATEAVRFPLYLRIPGWSGAPEVGAVARRPTTMRKSSAYLVINRECSGDTVELWLLCPSKSLPPKNQDASVHYGPIAPLRLAKSTAAGSLAEHEIFPTTPFNYGLVLSANQPASSFTLTKRQEPLDSNPFTQSTAPLTLTAKAKRIPQWTLDANGLLNPLQASPVKSSEPEETVTLIPMGAARLRMTAFPVIGEGPKAKAWTKPARTPQASYCWQHDTTAALNDGRLPKSSNDPTCHGSIVAAQGYHRMGAVQLREARLSAAEVYWFDDEPAGVAAGVPNGCFSIVGDE